jgi:uncharacterized protein (DUF1697 family)
VVLSPVFVALLRGINVGTSPRIPMADLRTLCEGLGWRDVQSYIQSGNLVFRAAGRVHSLEKQLEDALPDAFGVAPSVIIRTSAQWLAYPATNPFIDEVRDAPNLVMLALSKQPIADDAVEKLRARATSERIERAGDALWIHYGDGAGRSKLTPGLLDRAVGSPTTTRNWRTVMKLCEMIEGL